MIDAHQWLAHDPDPKTRAELEHLLAADHDAAAERFAARLVFGTAGIRGAQGAGPNRMNRLTVRRLGAGVAQYLGAGASVVIGFDARRNSDVFAQDLAAVLSRAGIGVQMLPEPTPTPVLAFSVLELGTDLGLMVTASHNPPADNGCKVFLADGAQLRAPVDTEIDALIEAAPLPPVDIVADPELVEVLDGSIQRRYESTVAAVVGDLAHPPPVVAYTALHGVGDATLQRAFAAAGLPAPHSVPEQQEPDPAFPTVTFPNPEEPGAMDLVIALADEIGADLAIANDPDADRFAAAIPDGDAWRSLSGDEVGAVLCRHVLDRTAGDDRLVVSTVVCSSLVDKIARAAGVAHKSTLTGFKWIMAEAYADPTLRPVLAYEESLGYALTDAVHDKDGISAALAFVALTAELAADGRSVADLLAELAVEHGLHTTLSESVRFDGFDGVARAGALVNRLRADPPSELDGRTVTGFADYAEGADGLPATNMIRLVLDDRVRLLLRPSGTEPKLKMYFEQVDRVADVAEVPVARDRARTELDELASALQRILTTP